MGAKLEANFGFYIRVRRLCTPPRVGGLHTDIAHNKNIHIQNKSCIYLSSTSSCSLEMTGLVHVGSKMVSRRPTKVKRILKPQRFGQERFFKYSKNTWSSSCVRNCFRIGLRA